MPVILNGMLPPQDPQLRQPSQQELAMRRVQQLMAEPEGGQQLAPESQQALSKFQSLMSEPADKPVQYPPGYADMAVEVTGKHPDDWGKYSESRGVVETLRDMDGGTVAQGLAAMGGPAGVGIAALSGMEGNAQHAQNLEKARKILQEAEGLDLSMQGEVERDLREMRNPGLAMLKEDTRAASITPEQVEWARRYILRDQVSRDYKEARPSTLPGTAAEMAVHALPMIRGYGLTGGAVRGAEQGVARQAGRALGVAPSRMLPRAAGAVAGGAVASSTGGLPTTVRQVQERTAPQIAMDEDGNLVTQQGEDAESAFGKEAVQGFIYDLFLMPWLRSGGMKEQFDSLLTRGGWKSLVQRIGKLEAARILSSGAGLMPGTEMPQDLETAGRQAMDAATDPAALAGDVGMMLGAQVLGTRTGEIVDAVRRAGRGVSDMLARKPKLTRTDLEQVGIRERTSQADRDEIQRALQEPQEARQEPPREAIASEASQRPAVAESAAREAEIQPEQTPVGVRQMEAPRPQSESPPRQEVPPDQVGVTEGKIDVQAEADRQMRAQEMLPPDEPPKAPPSITPDGADAPLPEGYATRQADTAAQREAMGLPGYASPESRSAQQDLEQARQMGMVERADAIATDVIRNPRPLTPVEEAAFRERQRRAINEYRRLSQELEKTTDEGDVRVKIAEIERVEDEYRLLADASDKAGSEWGRTGVARQINIDENYDILSVKTRAAVKKGSKLTPEETRQLETLVKDLEAKNEALAERDRKIDMLIAETVLKGQKNPYAKMDEATRTRRERELATKVSELLRAGC